MVVYALLATAGSAVGCVMLYYVSRRAGSRALKKFSPSKQARVKELIDRYDFGPSEILDVKGKGPTTVRVLLGRHSNAPIKVPFASDVE